MNPLYQIAEVMRKYPDAAFLVDAVSAMAGVKIEVDKLGIDVCLAGVQKAFALPPGLAIASVSERALKRAEELERGYYFNFSLMNKYHLKNQTPCTPSIPHLYALNQQMDEILEKEGKEGRFARHEKMAGIVQRWARKYFSLFPEEGYESKTVSCIKNTRGISVAKLNEELGKRNMMIANGYRDLKEKTFRIAHMGDLQPQDVMGLLDTIEEILDL
jgi:aspartate aminotransferase-like enzyme